MELSKIQTTLEDAKYKLFFINKKEEVFARIGSSTNKVFKFKELSTNEETIDVSTNLDIMVNLEQKLKKQDHKKTVKIGSINGLIKPIITKNYVLINDIKETKTNTIIRDYYLKKYCLSVQFIYDMQKNNCVTYLTIIFEKKNINKVVSFLKNFNL
jgi:hypothetical protein